MRDLIRAKELLDENEYTCVLCKENSIFTSQNRGVKPIYDWYVSDTSLEGFCAADKVVGKATAFLYVLLKVEVIYAKVISEAALDVLNKSHIKVGYDKLVKNIINRNGDDICPFEKAVLDINDEKKAFEIIKQTMVNIC